MVPEALAGKGGRRGARIPPHASNATRRAAGLEAAVVDNAEMDIPALSSSDSRVYRAKVAGPAALLVAKLHKLGERQDTPTRLVDKDAHDIYRILVAIATADLAARLRQLQTDGLAGAVTNVAIDYPHVARAPRSASLQPPTSRSSSMTTTPSPRSSKHTVQPVRHDAARRHPWGWTTWSTATGAARSRCAGCTFTSCVSSLSTAGMQTSCASRSSASSAPATARLCHMACL